MAKVYRNPRMRNTAGKPAWCLLYKGLDGKWRRERTDAVTREQAEALLRRKVETQAEAQAKGLKNLDHLKPLPFEHFFWEEYMPAFQARVDVGDCRPSTYRRKCDLAKHVLPHFGKMPLRFIQARDIRDFIEKRSKAKPMPSTAELNRERALISAVLSYAFQRGHVDVNETRRVKPLKERKPDLWLKPEDVEMVLHDAEKWMRPLIVVGAYAGMREAEISELRWANLEHTPGFIRVGEESKNHQARFIPLEPQAEQAIRSQPRRIARGAKLPWVFINPETLQPYCRFSVCHAFKRAARRASGKARKEGRPEQATRLSQATFHTLRHTYASWQLQSGMPIAEVQEYLGHSTDHMTRRYAKLAKADARALKHVGKLPSLRHCADTAQEGVAGDAANR